MILICVTNHLHFHLHYNLNFPHSHHHSFQALPPLSPHHYLILLLQYLNLIQYPHLNQHPLHFPLFEFIFSLTNPFIKIVILKVLHFKLPNHLPLKNLQSLILHHLLITNLLNKKDVPQFNCLLLLQPFLLFLFA